MKTKAKKQKKQSQIISGKIKKQPKEKSNSSLKASVVKKKIIIEQQQAGIPRELRGAAGWTKDELLELVLQVENALPSEDDMRFIKRARLLDWKSISVARHPSDECSGTWFKLQSKVRGHRTLTEMVHDAKMILKGPKKVKHPLRPKIPRKPFDFFFEEKKDEIIKQNQHLKKGQESKEAAALYKKLSEEERQKYIAMAADKLKEYDAALKIFNAAHPEFAASK